MIEKVSNPLFKEHLQPHDNPMKSVSEDMTPPPQQYERFLNSDRHHRETSIIRRPLTFEDHWDQT